MRAVTGSSSMPVTWQTSRSAAGISAGNRPRADAGLEHAGRRAKPSRCKPVQIARTMNSGVKWAYCVQRASEA